ncbi:hypothetical protein VNI00_002638 [Paramarasmius palmivorus]|uniref:GSKIP domain-containing protein n=1 Tax=Paramarasmius palmivorus TaxID=297713 RepID=A0AAW0DXU0_9AGAR
MEESMGSFYTTELQRALTEQGSTIGTFTMLEFTTLDAQASVTLLEGEVIRIILTERGYAIMPAQELDWDTAHIFETLEGLLQTASPLYGHQRQKKLLDALEKLANAQ